MELRIEQNLEQEPKNNKSKKHTVAVADGVYKEIQKYVKKSNEKKRGKVISVADVIKYAVALMKESDIPKIQEESLTIRDKISIEHEKYLQRTGEEMSLDEYIALKLKIQ